MKFAVILFAAVAVVQCNVVRVKDNGWSSSTTTSTTQAPITTGWPGRDYGWSSSTTEPTTTIGWPGNSKNSGWESSTTQSPSTTTGWPGNSKNSGWESSTTSTTQSPTTTTGWPGSGKNSGWESSTTQSPPTTTGWPGNSKNSGWPSSTTEPSTTTQTPTTTGWPGKAAGWGNPSPTPGWAPSGILTNINLNAALAATGSGWGAENHNEAVVATGESSGWGSPAVSANIILASGGESALDQDGSIIQLTSQDDQSALSLNNVFLEQVVQADEFEVVDAQGIDILYQQSGAADVSANGTSAAQANSSITVSKRK